MFTGGAAIIDLDTRFDWRVLLFAVALTMVCGLAAGILPALRSTRIAPTDAIKAQARQVGHAGGRRGALVGKSLVAAQMAFCLLLLVVAGLFIRSMQALVQTDVGFDRDRLLVARMDVRSMGYANEQRQALYDRVLERASPHSRRRLGERVAQRTARHVVARQQPDRRGLHAGAERTAHRPTRRCVTADYFETVGLAHRRRPRLHADDARPGGRSTIVNQTMARRFFPRRRDRQALDHGRARCHRTSPVIVGVVQDAKYIDVRSATPNMVYRVRRGDRQPDVLGNLEIRTAGRPSAAAPTIRQALCRARTGACRSSTSCRSISESTAA